MTTAVVAPHVHYPQEFQRFTEDNTWILLEDENYARLLERWSKAEVIVKTGGVHKDGFRFTVQSQGSAEASYQVVLQQGISVQVQEETYISPFCTCRDYQNYLRGAKTRAPHGWCKHLLAAYIHQGRSGQGIHPSQSLTKEESTMQEAPVSWNVKYNVAGFDQMLTLRGEQVEQVLGEARQVIAMLQGFSGNGRKEANGSPTKTKAASSDLPTGQAGPNASRPICPECDEEAQWKEGTSKAGNRYAFWKCPSCNGILSRQKDGSYVVK